MNVRRAAPLTGVAFAVLFLASVAVSTVPKNTAPDKAWVAAYATHGQQARHLATGLLLVLAGLSLVAFLTHLWNRVAAARQSERLSQLPVLAAGVAATCIAAGGIAMGASSGSAWLFSQPIPSPDLLRFSNDLGFGLAGGAGMLAAALSVASVSLQARAAGVFSPAMARFSLLVSVVLLGSLAFIPILALLVWVVVVAITLVRRPESEHADVGTLRAGDPLGVRA